MSIEGDNLIAWGEELEREIARLQADFDDCNLTREHLKQQVIRLRAALQGTREVIALFYTLEALSDEGKAQLLKLRDRIDEALK